jgi:hypothetical protein
MATAKTLQARLARSLDQANTAEAAATKKTQAALDQVRRDYLEKAQPLQDKLRTAAPAAPATAPAAPGAVKLSISLFAGDFARLDAIRDYMAARGHRLSTSQAVKAALRTAPLSEALTAALDAIRAEDGRRGW